MLKITLTDDEALQYLYAKHIERDAMQAVQDQIGRLRTARVRITRMTQRIRAATADIRNTV